MKEVKKDVDIAVIFKKVETKQITLFEPKFITIGRLNPETMRFTDLIDQITYSHIIINDNNPYRYGLRMKLRDLRKIYGISNTEELFKLYLKELKQKKYYLVHQSTGNLNDIIFISEDKKYHDLLDEKDKDLARILETSDPFYDINKLISNIRSNVIGQDDAIEELVSILWRNSRRENKNNILLMGPTGVGKTEIIRTLEKTLVNIPIITIDVSNYTKTGYKGESVTDILKYALNKCCGDIRKVENSIIVLDEFDKLAKKGNGDDDVTTKGVQQELLKLLEDGEYSVELGDEIYFSQKVLIKTKGITFILAGAFDGLFEEKFEKTAIGFITDKTASPTPKIKSPKKNVMTEDLQNFGIIPELIGRIHNRITLNSLSSDNLISIMKNPNYYVINDNIKVFKELGITVKINENAYTKLANVSLQKKTGARGLVGSIENMFSKAALDAKRNAKANGYNYLEITEDTVLDNSKYILKRVKKKENQ